MDGCLGLGDRLRSLSSVTFGKYCLIFGIGDWVLDGDTYKLTILQSVHMLGDKIDVEVHELVGLDFHWVGMHEVEFNVVGDVVIRVVSDPDARFNGRVFIS